MRYINALLVLVTTLPTLLYAQDDAQPDGGPCAQDSDCNSRWCAVPAAGPGNHRCTARPATPGASCIKDQEASDCTTKYCDAEGKCGYIDIGQPCTSTDQCSSAGGAAVGLCVVSPFYGGVQSCVATNLNNAEFCDVDAQCKSGCCPKNSFQCFEASACQAPNTDGTIENGQACNQDLECKSTICDDEINNDGFKKVCLPKSLAKGEKCSTNRQCESTNCWPADTTANDNRKPLTCSGQGETIESTGGTGTGTESGTGTGGTTDNGTGTGSTTDNGTGEGSGTNPENGSGSGNNPNVETLVTVENGQTRTEIRTRTTYVSASRSATGTASRSGTGGAVAASAAGASASGGAIARIDGHAGWMGWAGSLVALTIGTLVA